MRGNLKDNQVKLDSYEKSVQAALERKRQVIMKGKQIAYDMLSELYGLEGQALVDTATIEHTLIGKLTASGMTHDRFSRYHKQNRRNQPDSGGLLLSLRLRKIIVLVIHMNQDTCGSAVRCLRRQRDIAGFAAV